MVYDGLSPSTTKWSQDWVLPNVGSDILNINDSSDMTYLNIAISQFRDCNINMSKLCKPNLEILREIALGHSLSMAPYWLMSKLCQWRCHETDIFFSFAASEIDEWSIYLVHSGNRPMLANLGVSGSHSWSDFESMIPAFF